MSHADLLKRLLSLAYDANGAAISAGLHAEGAALDAAQQSADALLAEMDPCTTVALFADWERVAGLPDNCCGTNQTLTLAQRRQQLVAKITARGGQSRQFFVALAAALGYHDVAISEFRMATCTGNCEQSLRGEDWLFAWQMDIGDHLAIHDMSCADPCDSPLRSWQATELQCRVEKTKPAHTIALMNWFNSPFADALQTAPVTIPRFDPKYWRIDGPRTTSFCVTPYGNGLEATFLLRRNDVMCGLVWDSVDSKDHMFLAYETNKNYRNCVWDFDVEFSALMPLIDSATQSPVLSVFAKDAVGADVTYYVPLFRYATTPNSRASHIKIDWNTVTADFYGTTPMYVQAIDQIMLSCITTSFVSGTGAPLLPAEEGYIRITNSVVTGTNATLKINKIQVPAHSIGMATSYDDHYDQNPQRIVENCYDLGYREWINHYVGMSSYPARIWDAGQQRFVIPAAGSAPVVNPAATKWHTALAAACQTHNFKLIQSVSFEMFSETAQLGWTQRDWADNYAHTGYTPTSYFFSPCSAAGMAYLHQVFTEFADAANAAGAPVYMQVGEPWWWFNMSDRKPCIYDYDTKLAFNAATGLYMADFGTVDSVLTGSPYVEMKTFLQNALGSAVQSCRTVVRTRYPAAEVSVLFFLPSIIDPSAGIMQMINYPKTHYTYPNFDTIFTEAYDWLMVGHLSVAYAAMEVPLNDLGYPPDKLQYLAGFVPDAVLAPLYGFSGPAYRKQIWQRIIGNVKNNQKYNIGKQHIWSYVQVMADSITLLEQNNQLTFYMGTESVNAIRDDTPYV